jgi:hypothetical protein
MRWAWLVLGALACAEDSYKGDGSATFFDSSTGATTTVETGTTPVAPAPAWYHLDASFVVAGGILDPATATVQATLHGADGAALCHHTVAVTAVEAVARPAAERDLLAWWRVELGDGDPDGACAPFPARTVWWGVGPWDAALDPARIAAGLDEATANAGVLRETEDGPTWLVGAVGTADQLAGYAPPAAARPLPDGAYQWVGLILLPYPAPAG